MAEFLNDSIKGVEELNKQLALLKKELKEVSKVAADTVKSINVDKAKSEEIQKLTKAQQTLVTTTKELSKIEKQEADLVAKMNVLRSGEQDEILKLKAQQAELLKQKKLEAKENQGLITQYQKQSKHLRDLKNEFKDATLQGTKTKKELSKMRKEVIRLDNELVELDNSVNDSFRNIGKYEQALENTKKQMIKLAAASAGVAAAFSTVKGSLEANEEGSEELRKATGKLDAVMNVTKNTIATAALDLWEFGSAVASGDKSLLDIGDAFEATGKKIDTFGKDVKGAVAASDEATDSQIKLEKISRGLRKSVEVLNGEIDKQNAIAGDSTKGMTAIAEANELALVAEQKRNTILVELAKSELAIINARINATANGANNLTLKNEQAEKEIELIGLKNDLTTSTLELDKEIAVNERDQYEKALDFALDLFDTQKTLNERGIADETKTFNERTKLLNRTKELADKAFQEQIKLSEDFTEESLDLNELVAIDDQKIIYDRINALTQDEIVQQRLLDIIRDRKTAVLDLADSERELNQAIKERGEEDAKLNAEEAQDLEDAANNLTQFRLNQKEGLENEKAASEFRAGILLNNEELLADERILIEEELQAEIKALKDAAFEEDKARIDAQRKEAFKIAKDITGELGEELAKRNAEKLSSIDDELGLAETAIEKQEELASKGLDNTLAFEKERANKINLQRKEELKKQQQQEEAIKLAEAFISSFEARVSDNPNTAIQLATKDVFLARGIAKGLAAGFAYDGVEDTGEGGGLDDKNGKLWMLHPNERVMSKKQNQLVGDLSNDELSNLAFNYRMGIPIEKEKALVMTNNNSEVVSELRSLKDTIKKQPFQQVDVDGLGNIIETINNGTIKRVTKLKTRSRL